MTFCKSCSESHRKILCLNIEFVTPETLDLFINVLFHGHKVNYETDNVLALIKLFSFFLIDELVIFDILIVPLHIRHFYFYNEYRILAILYELHISAYNLIAIRLCRKATGVGFPLDYKCLKSSTSYREFKRKMRGGFRAKFKY